MTPEPAATESPAGSGVFSSGSASSGAVRRNFTTRRGGVSQAPYDSFNLGGGVGDDPVAVAVNRGRLAAAVGFPADRLFGMRQRQGVNVEPFAGPDGCGEPIRTPDAD